MTSPVATLPLIERFIDITNKIFSFNDFYILYYRLISHVVFFCKDIDSVGNNFTRTATERI